MTQKVDISPTEQPRVFYLKGDSISLDMPDEQLVGIFAAAQQETKEAQDRAWKLEQELRRRIRENGGNTLEGTGMNYVMSEKIDITKIVPLIEELSPEQKTKCVKEAHWSIPKDPEWIETKYDKGAWETVYRAKGSASAFGIAYRATLIPDKGKLVTKEG